MDFINEDVYDICFPQGKYRRVERSIVVGLVRRERKSFRVIRRSKTKQQESAKTRGEKAHSNAQSWDLNYITGGMSSSLGQVTFFMSDDSSRRDTSNHLLRP